MYRTHTVKELVSAEPGAEVTLAGWVHRRRDHGPITFLDLRNRTELVQVVMRAKDFDEATNERLKEEVRPECVVQVAGTVQARKAGTENKDLATGAIEVVAKTVTVVNSAATPAFVLDEDEVSATEETRMKYRYLDLRRIQMQKNIALRQAVTRGIREFLWSRDFLEVDTPILGKSTPEGARDYLVPSRVHNGKFYALPQSPQQYKQLFMVSGIERYFQIVRCFRDEDTRGDRQPEFTQLDLEMSFVEQEDILRLTEELFIEVTKKVSDKQISAEPFPRLTYKEAMDKYGTDRPDLRKNLDDPNELAFCWVTDFPMFERRDDGSLAATHHPFTMPDVADAAELKAVADPLTVTSRQHDLVLNGNEIAGGSVRTHDPELLAATFEVMGHKPEDVQEKFGHLLEAFRYGVPPHGGIAPGLDRYVMVLASEPTIREVIPFPKTGDGRDLMMNAPSDVSPDQLAELGIRVVK